jgi:hypothetical protein
MALSGSLSVAGRLPATALTTTNYAICATVGGRLVVKAPDWCFVPAIRVPAAEVERSYTPHLEGDRPLIVMEFLSDTPGGEYDRHGVHPYGKWFFYERILQVPYYAIFDIADGALEVYRLDDLENYVRAEPDERQHYWIGGLGLALGVWWGTRDNRTAHWLRWWDKTGCLLLWRAEVMAEQARQLEQAAQRAEQERRRAEQAQQQIEQERRRAEQAQQQIEQERRRAEQAEQARREAVPQLLAAGLSAEQVATALGLTVEAVKSLSE